ncbi:DNA-binding protein [Rhodococcus sp. ABRD24]|uniref:DNA-binding protein n=1 Tax=Rhodococcus sp. ABRD24 TaxID=2507582 RepID=UPI00103BEE9C|nr:DNA-binding protein [Rhodococcus sp. ABRD24]QBJ94984.1 DNA-binding protein [Rhodococcus sp. ABRD24]
MTQQQWAEEQAQRIAQTVKDLRGKRSGQWLSDRTAEAGHRISRSTIADLESGRRKYVTTAELSVLAWALQIPPISLLYPALPDGEVELVPGNRVSSITAATWFSGETTFQPDLFASDGEPLPEDERLRNLEQVRAVEDGARLVYLSRERIKTESEIDRLTRVAARMRTAGSDEVATQMFSEVNAKQHYLDYLSQELKKTPGAVVSDGG